MSYSCILGNSTKAVEIKKAALFFQLRDGQTYFGEKGIPFIFGVGDLADDSDKVSKGLGVICSWGACGFPPMSNKLRKLRVCPVPSGGMSHKTL